MQIKGVERVEAEVQKIIDELYPDVFIVEINLHQGGRSVLLILIDTDDGLTISVCTHISRKLNIFFAELEENGQELFDFPFKLEVGSPGVGSPLKIKRQYFKNIGRKLKVSLEEGEVIKGILEKADEEGIVLRPKAKKKKKKGEIEGPETLEIRFEEIKEAKVEISFD